MLWVTIGCLANLSSNEVDRPAELADVFCRPELQLPPAVPPPTSDFGSGQSVAGVSFGADTPGANTYRAVVVGAPGLASDPSAVGSVFLTDINTLTGQMDQGAAWNHALVGGPTDRHFGWALLAADIQAGFGGQLNRAYGVELVVGAPDLAGDSKGAAYVFRPVAAGDPAAYELVGQVPEPSGLSNQANFGYAFGIARNPFFTVPNPDSPWSTAPDATAMWLAVGAPGEGNVYIYSVDVGQTGMVLTHVQTVEAPTADLSQKGFGAAIAIGDFDDDELPDLAVAAPFQSAASPNGAVVVCPGAASGASPVDENACVTLDGAQLWSGASPEYDGFGTALATGRLSSNDGRDTLLVGSPRLAPQGFESGGVVWFKLRKSGGSFAVDHSLATLNPFTANPKSGDDHFGASLTAGNFNAEDGAGSTETKEARVLEVGVGAPGWDGGTGRVSIFLDSVTNGPDFAEVQSFLSPSASGVGLGMASAAFYAQESHWQDIVAAGPLRQGGGYQVGQVQLSRTVLDPAAASCPSGIDGDWSVADVNGGTSLVRVSHRANATGGTDVRLALTEPLAMNLVDEDSGALCVGQENEPDSGTWDTGSLLYDVEGDIPRGTVLDLDGAFPCGQSSHTWVDAEVGSFVKGVLQALGGWSGLSTPFQDVLEGMKGDVTVTLDVSVSPRQIYVDVDIGDWGLISIFLGTTDGACVLNAALSPLAGVLDSEPTCE